MNRKKTLGLIIPAYNEGESIDELYFQIKQLANKHRLQIVFINDGSTDDTLIAMNRKLKDSSVTVIDLQRNYGKALALQAGFDCLKKAKKKCDYVATLDADLQDNPLELSKLINKLEEGYGLVVGWKKHRLDPWSKRIASRVANGILRAFTKVAIHDMNTGIKVMSFSVMSELNLYSDLHRFIPALVAAKGHLIGEVPVDHRKRLFGKSKYGPGRMAKSIFDFMTLIMLTKFASKPLHFFGPVGIISFSFGVIIALYLTILWFSGQSIGDRPLLMLAVLAIIFGVQMLSLGLLGDLIISQNKEARYSIRS